MVKYSKSNNTWTCTAQIVIKFGSMSHNKYACCSSPSELQKSEPTDEVQHGRLL